MKSDHPSLDVMTIVLILSVLAMGLLSCFFKPKYEVGFYAILVMLVTSLGGILSAKYALTQTKPTPGSVTDLSSHVVTPPEITAPAPESKV